jgi:hypothetical protein
VLVIFLTFCCLALAATAAAQTREQTLHWIQPEGPQPLGYFTYLGSEPGVYSEVLDLGPVSPEADGTRRTTLILDALTPYYISISAYNEVGESPLSDEIFSASAACLSAVCNDENPCTADNCIAEGCTHTPLSDGAPCDPGDAGYGLCSDGLCQPAECIADADCDDGDTCNGLETCSWDGLCVSGSLLSCGEPTQCQAPSCDPLLGCVAVAVADGSPCEDGDRWTSGDQCQSGVCMAGPRTKARGRSNGKSRGRKK